MKKKTMNRWLVVMGAVLLQVCIAALAGPIIVANAGGLIPTFIISAVLSILGGLMTFLVKSPNKALA